MDHLDFELIIGAGRGSRYPVKVIRSPAGDAHESMAFPFSELVLEKRLQELEIALLSSGAGRRRTPQKGEEVEAFGTKLFDALFTGEIRNRYDVSRHEARQKNKGLRIKLRFESPQLAALPWEFLFDSRRGDFVCLSVDTPLVRYLEVAQPMEPLTVTPPLRVLGLVASPKDLDPLDVERECMRIDEATRSLAARGVLEFVWSDGTTWRDLQRALRNEIWHVFHFVGHGGFSETKGSGLIMLTDDSGNAFPLAARDLARLLGNHHHLRLAMLNSCEGARADKLDVFSSTAATLVRRGTPAVVAMQYEISDLAAVELARSFYEAIADGYAVDSALAEARTSVSVALANTLEWGTPVLYMRSPDGVLFDINGPRPPTVPAKPPPVAPPTGTAEPPLGPAPQRTPKPSQPSQILASGMKSFQAWREKATTGKPPPAPMRPPPLPNVPVPPRQAPTAPRFCRKCGTERMGDAVFCRRCGMQLK